MQGFLLGLSTGAICLASCAPALVPFLLGEGKGIRKNTVILCQFLVGRLFGYLLFAVLAWATNHYIIANVSGYELFLGLVYIVLAVSLALYGVTNPTAPCAGRSFNRLLSETLTNRPALAPVCFGFITGLNLCPPFLLALATASELQTLSQILLFFFSFFIGTTLYFIPAPFLGVFSSMPPLKTIGKLAALVTAVYYLYTGILMFAGGLGYL
jgi:hypothetical protein